MSKFNKGDMVKNIGYGVFGHLNEVGVVLYDDCGSVPYRVRFSDGTILWFKENQLSLANPTQKIIITHDNHTTKARLYEGDKLIKTAEAKCAPSDTFDFLKEGAPRAFSRLVGEDKDKHVFKAGDKVVVISNTCNHDFKIRSVITFLLHQRNAAKPVRIKARKKRMALRALSHLI